MQPKAISPADPAARYTGANGDRPFFAYSTNYLVDLDNAVIVDVDANAPIRQAEVEITKDMILRTRDRFGLYPEKLVAGRPTVQHPCWVGSSKRKGSSRISR